MKAKIIPWIMAVGLVLLMSTVVWADGRNHQRHSRRTERIAIEKYHPGPYYPQFRKHPAYNKRRVVSRRGAPHYYVDRDYCGPVQGYPYYKVRPRHSNYRVSGARIVPGWTFSISSGGRW